jgi:long-chain acyl-CoA synthetase
MSSTVPAASGTAAAAATMVEAFRITSQSLADRVAIRTKDDEFTLTWAQWRARSLDLAGGLYELGLRRGQTMAIMLGNRPEFHIADIAAVMLGATPFSIYQTYTPEQIEFLLADAESHVAIIESQYLERFLQARNELTTVEHVILVDPPADGALADGILTLEQVSNMPGEPQSCGRPSSTPRHRSTARTC